jgi:O-antigen ligase
LTFPIICATILAVLYFFTNFAFDFFAFKVNRKAIYKILFVVVTLIPVLQLITFEVWEKADVSRKILLFGIVLFLCCINFHTSYSFQIFGVFALCTLFYFFKKREFFRPSLFFILLTVYFVYNAISIFWSSDTAFGLQKMAVYSLYLLIPLAFSVFSLTKKEVDMILLIFVRAMFFFIFVSLCSWILQNRVLQIPFGQWFDLQEIAIYNYNGTVIITNRDILFAWLFRQHETYYSFAYIFAFFLSIYYFLNKKTENYINVTEFIFGLILIILCSALSHARIALVFCILALVMGIGNKLLKRKTLLVTFGILGFITSVVLLVIFREKLNFFISDRTRPLLFQIAWENICQRPLFGTGLGGMKQIYTAVLSVFSDYSHTNVLHPHNQFLADFMQTGILGLVIVVSITIYTFYLSIKRRNFLLFVFILMWLQLMMIESPMLSERGVFYFALIACVLAHRKIMPEQ